MPSLRGLNQDEKDREELAIFVAKQMENFVFPHHHHRDIPTTNFKENNGPQIAGRHEEKAAEAGAANGICPPKLFDRSHIHHCYSYWSGTALHHTASGR